MPRILVLIAAVLTTGGLVSGCSSESSGSTAPDRAASPATSSAPDPSTSAVTTLSPSDFLVAASVPGVDIVDVRTPAEYEAGHVSGAVNVDVLSSDFATQIEALPRDGSYAVYCRSGNRSAVAAEQMAAAGFTNVINLDGGLAELEALDVSIESG